MKDLTFRQAAESDFNRIREIALKGWMFAYSHLPKDKLVRLVNKYYSVGSLTISLERVRIGTDSFIVAELDGKAIGFCHVTASIGIGELLRLYIDTSYIRKGVGKGLLLLGEKFLISKKCKKYFTFVNRHNRVGLDFYTRNGFVRAKKKDKEDEFKEGKVLWCMEKNLLNDELQKQKMRELWDNRHDEEWEKA